MYKHILLVLLLCAALSYCASDVVIGTALPKELEGKTDIQIKESIMPTLITNNADLLYGEAVFEVNNFYNYDARLDLDYTEVSGHVDSTQLYLWSSIEKRRQVVDHTEIVVTSNETLTIPVYRGETYYEETWVLTDTVPARYNGPIKVKIGFDRLNIGSKVRIDWVPTFSVQDNTKKTLLTVSRPEWAWFNSSWSYAQNVTVDKDYIDTPLLNFPVFVNLSADNFDFSHANITGKDLRFTNVAGDTEYVYWVKSWDNIAETAEVWVLVPSLNNTTGTVFTMYYGNVDATDRSNATGVFDNEHLMGRWFLDEGSGTDIYDITANDHDITVTSWTSYFQWVDNGLFTKKALQRKDYDYPSGGTVTGIDQNNVPHDNLTISVWYKSPDTSIENNQYVLRWSTFYSFYFHVVKPTTAGAGRGQFYFRGYDTTDSYAFLARSADIINIGDTNWHYLVGARTRDANNESVILYFDGAPVTDYIYQQNYDNGTRNVSGVLLYAASGGETGQQHNLMSLWDTAVSPAWVKAEYATIAEADFLTLGPAVEFIGCGVGTMSAAMTTTTYWYEGVVCDITTPCTGTHIVNWTSNITGFIKNSTYSWRRGSTIYSAHLPSNYNHVGERITCSVYYATEVINNATNYTDIVPSGKGYTFTADTFPDMITDFSDGYFSLILAMLALGCVYILTAGRTMSTTALAYGFVVIVAFFITSNVLFIYIGIIAVIAGLLLKYSGN